MPLAEKKLFFKQKIRMEVNFFNLAKCHSTDVANRVHVLF